MKATGKWLLAMGLMTVFAGQAMAESDKPGKAESPAMKITGWERVGDNAGNAQLTGAGARLVAPGEDGLQARKAEALRRMFWIMIAHR